MLERTLFLLLALLFDPFAVPVHGQTEGDPGVKELRVGTRFLSLAPDSEWRWFSFGRLPSDSTLGEDEEVKTLLRLARLLEGAPSMEARDEVVHALYRRRGAGDRWFRFRIQTVDDVEDFLERRVSEVRAVLRAEGARELEPNDVRGLGMRFARFELPTAGGSSWPFEWYGWSIDDAVLELVPLTFWEDVKHLSRDARAVAVDLMLRSRPLYADDAERKEEERQVGTWLVGIAALLVAVRLWIGWRRSRDQGEGGSRSST